MTCHRLFGRVVGATCYTTVNKYNIGGQIGGNLWTRHDSLCFSGPPSQTVCRHETTRFMQRLRYLRGCGGMGTRGARWLQKPWGPRGPEGEGVGLPSPCIEMGFHGKISSL